jgi:hypothetical protein
MEHLCGGRRWHLRRLWLPHGIVLQFHGHV